MRQSPNFTQHYESALPTINKKTPQRPWIPEKKPYKMKVSNEAIYNGAQWRKLAKRLKMEWPLCINVETCAGATYCIDHIIPITEGGAVFDVQNLQPLCRKCNASKTGKQAHKK